MESTTAELKCPRCGNKKSISTERRPNGNSTCVKRHDYQASEIMGCGYSGPTSGFTEDGRPNPNPSGDKISGYRKLPEDDVAAINAVKEVENALGDMLEVMRGDNSIDQRWLSIARIDLQKGFMALLRSIAKPESRL